jgi:anti-sigma factor RsiW
MIHCDDVFDILTRGPFPTGADSDGVVESHLTRCGECRRLAEALRPAIELFQEAVAPEESRGLPSYWGNSCDDADLWEDGEIDLPHARLPRRPEGGTRQCQLPLRSFMQAVPWAAAVLVGIALSNWLSHTDKSPDAALAGLTKPRWRLEQAPREWLFQRNVPEACYQTSVPSQTIMANLNGGDPSAAVSLACCKGCHAETSQAPTGSVGTNELLATCVACHQF